MAKKPVLGHDLGATGALNGSLSADQIMAMQKEQTERQLAHASSILTKEASSQGRTVEDLLTERFNLAPSRPHLPYSVSDQALSAYQHGLQALGELAEFAIGPGTPIQSEDQAYATIRLVLPHDWIELTTEINPLTNSRDQDGLSLELLAHIAGTWTGQNSIPAIGRWHEGKIEPLAGSCRRFVAIALKGNYVIDVGFDIPEAQARFVANTAESQMAQSAWERGKLALQLEQKDRLDRNVIAQRLSINAGDLSRMMNAVQLLETQTELKPYFGSYRSLGISALAALSHCLKPIADHAKSKHKLYHELNKLIANEAFVQLAPAKKPSALLKLVKTASAVAQGKQKPTPEPAISQHLWGDPSRKGAAVWSVTHHSKRAFTINTQRLTQEQIQRLLTAVEGVFASVDQAK